MNVVITGHRIQKLENYDTAWIRIEIMRILEELKKTNHIRGYSGMASGVDLWFCDICKYLDIRYVACPPFEEQNETMTPEQALHREDCLENADKIEKVRNSVMISRADLGIICWDGNKGGTHNVVQQFLEKKKNFIWINPISQVVWECYNEKP